MEEEGRIYRRTNVHRYISETDEVCPHLFLITTRQLLLNMMGLYVGLAGVRSANTLSLQTAKVRARRRHSIRPRN